MTKKKYLMVKELSSKVCIFNKFTRHEQICLIRLRFDRYYSPIIGDGPDDGSDDGRSISQNAA